MTEPRRAKLYPTDGGVPRIEELWPRADPTPGNVGLCISGGGSRSMTAGMGQLRALATLEANGRSLLSQIKALSVVSGGAWLSVPFVCMDESIPDEEYLGRYVEDPARLVLVPTSGHSEAETLSEIPPRSPLQTATDPSFGAPALFTTMMAMIPALGIEPTSAWQHLIGMHVLAPFGLYRRREDERAQPLFEVRPAPGREGRAPRPFLIVNTALFLEVEGKEFRMLAPLQVTPTYAGILGEPEGLDANGRIVGGGGVTTSALDSVPRAFEDEEVVIEQASPWALYEILGATSAFFALALQNMAVKLADDEQGFRQLLAQEHDRVEALLGSKLPLPPVPALTASYPAGAPQPLTDLRRKLLAPMHDLLPSHRYWGLRDRSAREEVERTRFADGGSVENTGIASLLAYPDIERVIAFVNCPKGVREADLGAFDAEGREVRGTRLYVEDQIPPLFGYQPWREGVGYRLYAGAEEPAMPERMRCQVFPAEAFFELLSAFASSWRGGRGPAVARLTLPVLENRWFCVAAREEPIELLILCQSRATDWNDRLRPEVQRFFGEAEDPKSHFGFPNIATAQTHLARPTANLLAHFSSWCVADPAHRDLYIDMFRAGEDQGRAKK